MISFSLGKRQKFILIALILTLILFFIQMISQDWRYQAVVLLIFLTCFLSIWSLKDVLTGLEWLVVPVLPTLFSGGLGLFYFFIPGNWWLRSLVVILSGFGFYVLLLTANIFSVAAIRTIQLLRSARAVGFLMTLLTLFFLYDVIYAFRPIYLLNFLLVFFVSFPLLFQAIWTVKLEEKLSSPLLSFTLVLSLLQAEAALIFSFWPVSVAVRSLALTTAAYVSLGLVQHYLDDRLFSKTLKEYISVGLVVLLAVIFTTRWSG